MLEKRGVLGDIFRTMEYNENQVEDFSAISVITISVAVASQVKMSEQNHGETYEHHSAETF